MPSVLVCFSTAVTSSQPNQLGGGEGSSYACSSKSGTIGSQGKNSVVAMVECCLPACWPWLAILVFLEKPGPTCPRTAVTTVGWVLPYLSLIKKCSTDLPSGQSEESSSSGEVCPLRWCVPADSSLLLLYTSLRNTTDFVRSPSLQRCKQHLPLS